MTVDARSARHAAARLAAVAVALTASACSLLGAAPPTEEEAAAWRKFTQERSLEHADEASLPLASVQQYVLGTTATAGADAVQGGRFTGARTELAADGQAHVIGTFDIESSIRGNLDGVIDIDVGPVPRVPNPTNILRGAGPCVVYLRSTSEGWALVDGAYAITPTGENGRLSAPLVGTAEDEYLAGVVDLADITALVLAGGVDRGGVLIPDAPGGPNDSGTTGGQQGAIDKANDLAG